ncbi:hypothetical protein P43SY_001970 [Pythium insidiosum]|uniref:SAP domain-containing protein n=1 Tax=Pythium insidiosum TaxID=114742 RepID=A0AAD5LPZ8_PYTIN|nr:hypothetical protein P43SY_001970 [Pythium insidiosum]
MDVWGSQSNNAPVAAAAAAADAEDEQWELEEKGRDALIVLVDARAAMFDAGAGERKPWFLAVVELLVKLSKSKVIAGDNSLLSVVFFGSNRKTEASSLEHVYEFQPLGYASAQRIKELQALLDDARDLPRELQSMRNSDALAFSNALWHCGIAFSAASLKKRDSQRVWIFTNDDGCVAPDADETARIQTQVRNHVELQRTLNLFYIPPPGRDTFDLARFYACAFRDFSRDDAGASDAPFLQPAFPVTSLDELMESSLRKRFHKRRLTTFPLHVTKDVSIGVELYATTVLQRKSVPVALDASTNAPLKSETKWLCDDTGAYLQADEIKKYIAYGGKRVYFTRDDLVQIKYYDAPGLQLICFKPMSSLAWNANIRAPYFVYPCDGYIEGSATAFVALLRAMRKKDKYALARLIARRTSEPRLVALVPQEEAYDELGQVQPTGFHVVFLPYVDDIRDIQADNSEKATDEQVEAAKQLIAKLKLPELPSFENPELQKHYASVQALALGEEQLEFDESKDTTQPDQEGFAQEDVQHAIEAFRDACGPMEESNLKRQEKAPARRAAPKKKAARGDTAASAGDVYDADEWRALAASAAIQKKTVAELKGFLAAQGLATVGRKADLVARVVEFFQA